MGNLGTFAFVRPWYLNVTIEPIFGGDRLCASVNPLPILNSIPLAILTRIVLQSIETNFGTNVGLILKNLEKILSIIFDIKFVHFKVYPLICVQPCGLVIHAC